MAACDLKTNQNSLLKEKKIISKFTVLRKIEFFHPVVLFS